MMLCEQQKNGSISAFLDARQMVCDHCNYRKITENTEKSQIAGKNLN